MTLNKIIKLSFALFFISVSCSLYSQNDEKASLKPAATVDAKTDKKDKKKAAKAEEKIHEQSKNDMDKQISEYHKPHYKKITKQKPAVGKSDKGL